MQIGVGQGVHMSRFKSEAGPATAGDGFGEAVAESPS